MTAEEPQVDLRHGEELAATCTRLEAAVAHLWFPGQPEHVYDRVKSADRVAFQAILDGSTETAPADIEVVYYTDPLQRLVALHNTTIEMMTGNAYHSPWKRDDAQFR